MITNIRIGKSQLKIKFCRGDACVGIVSEKLMPAFLSLVVRSSSGQIPVLYSLISAFFHDFMGSWPFKTCCTSSVQKVS